MILADTDVLIDYLEGVSPAKDQIASYVARDELQTSAVTCFELLSGAREGRKGDRLRAFVAALSILPLDRGAAECAARIRQQLEREGRKIGMGDSLIAGIALANQTPLFTRNRKHFERVEGLALVPLDQAVP